jgi:lipopolysaccharide transport system permease protein
VTLGTVDLDLTSRPLPLRRLVADVWAARRLMSMLARKDFLVRYRRTSFGLLWAAGLPLLQGVVLALVFSRVTQFHVGTSYPVFVFAGVLPWTFFSATLSGGATSVVDSAGLASKIYFPRAVLPLVVVLSSLYPFAAAIAVLLGMCLVTGAGINVHILILPLAVMLLLALTTAFSLLFSALHVYFRDVRYLVQASLLVWFYVTPVVYPTRIAPPGLRAVLRANPVTGVVELFRLSTAGADPHWALSVAVTVAWTAVLGVVGVEMHRRRDRLFADLM